MQGRRPSETISEERPAAVDRAVFGKLSRSFGLANLAKINSPRFMPLLLKTEEETILERTAKEGRVPFGKAELRLSWSTFMDGLSDKEVALCLQR
jgi:hypothetical protein